MTAMNGVRRAVVGRKPDALQLLLVLLGLALATAVRWFTDAGAYGVPFATFLPVIVLAAIFLDWPFAIAAVLLSLAIVQLLFPVSFAAFSWPTLILLIAYALTATFLVLIGQVLRRTIQEMHRQAEQFQTYNAELQHRAKNAVQIVRALAARASKAPDPVEFYKTLATRLDLMVKANELLGVGMVRQCDIRELARVALQPFCQDAVSVAGASAQVTDDAALPLVMALHELGTNALKYGALSADSGSVSVSWEVSTDAIELVWRESGGPEVVAPTKRGLGSRLLVAQGALRSVDLQFQPEGVTCRMVVPRAD